MTITNIKLTEARQKAEEAGKQIEAAQAAMAEAVKTALTEGFNVLFEEHPFLGSVVWSQYTPYFNDGDTCVFSSQIEYPSINSVKDLESETDASGGEEPGEDFGQRSQKETWTGYDQTTRRSTYEANPDYDPRYGECEEAVRDFVKALVGPSGKPNWETPSTFDSALLKAFGDHATVTVTRKGIEVDHCEHE